jgi:hypothetical protein
MDQRQIQLNKAALRPHETKSGYRTTLIKLDQMSLAERFK